MNKKKAALCSFMFLLIISAAYIAAMLISETVRFWVQGIMCGSLLCEWSREFYRWLVKQEGTQHVD